jgi:O-methyltransferase
MKNIIKSIFSKAGFVIAKIPKNKKRRINNFDEFFNDRMESDIKYLSIENSKHDYEIVKNHTMVPFGNLASLYEQVRLIEFAGIDGDFVECGVWKGGSAGMMALSNLRYGTKRRTIHLFDAFDDICEPNPIMDGERAIAEAKKYASKDASSLKGDLKPMKGFYDFLGGHGTIKDCYDLLTSLIKYDEKNIRIYKGWFQDTFKKHSGEIGKIAVLRLDADWYESTKLSLEYFYDKVVEGGFIIFDDYGTYEGCKRAVDEFLSNRNLKKHLLNSFSLNPDSYFIIK